MLALLVFALAAPSADPLPASDTADAPDRARVEVVRVKRDFGKPHFDLAIDAWADDHGHKLERARLWWVNTAEHDRRKPLGALIERMVKLQYARVSKHALTVTVTGDGHQFTFTVELDEAGQIHAFVDIDSDDGRFVPRCRTTGARLVARRVLGLAVGLARIAVTCSDSAGTVHHGQVRQQGA